MFTWKEQITTSLPTVPVTDTTALGGENNLFLAARHGYTQIVRNIIQTGANLAQKDC